MKILPVRLPPLAELVPTALACLALGATGLALAAERAAESGFAGACDPAAQVQYQESACPLGSPGNGGDVAGGGLGSVIKARLRGLPEEPFGSSAADVKVDHRQAGPGEPEGGPLEKLTEGAGHVLSDAEEVVRDVAAATAPVGERAAFPLFLLLVLLGFLGTQNRIDRRDPKLRLAPMDSDEGLAFGPPFPARRST